MMKRTKKVLALAFAFAMVAPMAACGTPQAEEVPEGRTQIKISMYVGGYGAEWMDNLITRLNGSQEAYWYTRNPDNKMASEEITDKILGGVVEADIYFTTPADIEPLIGGGYLEDLTEVYEYTPEGESLKIKDKTLGYENYETYLSDDNGIYAMPNQYNLNSTVYDHDLFETMGWLKEDSGTENGLTKGADGVEGTYDDGLPVTYSEFKTLIADISTTATPFIYADSVGFDQLCRAVEAIWAQYEGAENYKVGAMYNGTYTSPSTGVTTQVTPSEGWKVYANNLQEGRWKAAEYIADMHLNPLYMYGDLSGLTHTDAQSTFVISHATEKPIAMLCDGCWWENEAKRAFADDAGVNGPDYAYGKRDFRLMPVPAFDGQVEESNGKHYFQGGAGASSFAVKQEDPVKKQGVLDFFKEYASDWNCKNYTKSTGCIAPFKYTMTDEELATLSPFARNVFEIYSDPSTVVVDTYWYEKGVDLNNVPERWGMVKVNNVTRGTHWEALRNGATLEEYKNGVLNETYTSSNWVGVTD